MMAYLIIGAVVLFAIYLLAEIRGVARVLKSLVCSVPAAFVSGLLLNFLTCGFSNDPYCDLTFFIMLPIIALLAFFIPVFLPGHIFKPISGFFIGAAIVAFLLFLNRGFSIYTFPLMLLIFFAGLLGSLIPGNKVSSIAG